MKILVLIGDRCQPLLTPLRLRHASLWTQFRPYGAEVRLLGLDSTPDVPFSSGPDGIESEFLPAPPLTGFDFYLHHTTNPLFLPPLKNRFASLVDKTVKEWQPDIIHAEGLDMARYLPCVRGKAVQQKQSALLFDSTREYLREGGATHLTALRPVLDPLHALSAWFTERKVVAAVDLALAYGKTDYAVLRARYPDTAWALVPGGGRFSLTQEFNTPQAPNLLMPGDYREPNMRQSLFWMLDNVLPLFDKDIQVTVSGTGISHSMLQRLRTYKRIRLEENPKSMSDFMRQHAGCLVPLQYSSSARDWVLWSISNQRTAITTSAVAKDLGLEMGEGVLLADSPDRYARKATQVAVHRKEATVIAQQGFRICQGKNDWPVLAKTLMAHWKKLNMGLYLTD